MTAVPDEPLLVLVGGVPGAGKSTLLARVADDHPGARVLDPDPFRRRLAALLPGVPYRLCRPVVHTRHAVTTLGAVLRGPAASPEGVLLVHDPATRPGRREALARLARSCGWRPVLMVVDVPRQAALDGQSERGRVVRPRSFARHWERWSAQRSELMAAAARRRPLGSWAEVHVVDRTTALPAVRGLLGRRSGDLRGAAVGPHGVGARAGQGEGPGRGHEPVRACSRTASATASATRWSNTPGMM